MPGYEPGGMKWMVDGHDQWRFHKQMFGKGDAPAERKCARPEERQGVREGADED